MSEFIDVSSLFPLQAGLDEEIQSLHHLDYPSTREKRILALLVELGEFANETRCFKFWSLKGPSPKEVILEEYADGLHFFLSLGIPLGVKSLASEKSYEGSLYEGILDTYEEVVALRCHYDEATYVKAFKTYLSLLPLFGATGEEAIEAYKKKLQVNYKRQETKY